jgi:predicted enzyme related to lactoylglutathione lyase
MASGFLARCNRDLYLGVYMTEVAPLSPIGHPVAELPVKDVERSQRHYRDLLGFKIEWIYPGKEIGAVSRGDVAVFFRKRKGSFEPVIHWVFAEDIDTTYKELQSRGARIVDPLAEKPWGLRQFTVEDLDGNRFYFHHG